MNIGGKMKTNEKCCGSCRYIIRAANKDKEVYVCDNIAFLSVVPEGCCGLWEGRDAEE
jgi:hypothetical protein